VEQARVGFLCKWKLRCKAVSASFEQAGDELLTFTAFPSSQWKALRTTNAARWRTALPSIPRAGNVPEYECSQSSCSEVCAL
jgi:hypothetical protein